MVSGHGKRGLLLFHDKEGILTPGEYIPEPYAVVESPELYVYSPVTLRETDNHSVIILAYRTVLTPHRTPHAVAFGTCDTVNLESTVKRSPGCEGETHR